MSKIEIFKFVSSGTSDVVLTIGRVVTVAKIDGPKGGSEFSKITMSISSILSGNHQIEKGKQVSNLEKKLYTSIALISDLTVHQTMQKLIIN